ncbi:hypothetical protein [Planococcus sp. CAU13]|uniref:hypothetical protein n=1 Tax=Planococcus sp. CAU13 TaxID=1541197 RepID=UPI00052FF0B7|nr:hypothetical protein [Planococcus sp. CAU13]
MRKNDFRVKLPLWNIALYTILMFWAYSVVYSSDMLFTGFEGVFNEGGEFALDPFALLSFFGGLVLIIIFFFAYFIRLNRHNKNNPTSKMSAFTIFKLGEFIEFDELFSQVTQTATKKIYVFYSQILPLLVLLMFFPFNRYLFIMVIFLLLIIQNLIYYRHIRSYITN